MPSGFAGLLFSLGLVALGFGVSFGILGALGSHYGTPHPSALMLTIVSLVLGGVLVGGSIAMNRSRDRRDV